MSMVQRTHHAFAAAVIAQQKTTNSGGINEKQL
jgi:hypothetical protein